MARKITLEILCMLFILLFVYTGFSKYTDHETFITSIRQVPLFKPIAFLMSIFVPAVEISVAGMIAIEKWRRMGLYIFTSMMFAFTIYVIIILNFAEKIPCSCGGVLASLGWRSHLILNSTFVVLGIIAILIHNKRTKEIVPKTA